MKVYHGSFASKEDIIRDFSSGWDTLDAAIVEELDNAEILFAAYTSECYDGEAVVIFEKDGELYEAGGSHCSCNGLEDQWSPEKTSYAALKMRARKDDYAECRRLLHQFLEERD